LRGEFIKGNILVLGPVADLEAQTFQPAQMPNRSTVLDLTMSPVNEPNAWYVAFFCFLV